MLLGIFTLALAFVVGLTCAFTNGKTKTFFVCTQLSILVLISLNVYGSIVFCVGTGKVILESAILTTVVVLSFTLYTFWAAKKGYDFNFLGPFLFGALLVLMVFAIIQVTPLFILNFTIRIIQSESFLGLLAYEMW